MGISKDTMKGRERAKAREAVCIIELQGLRHRQKVPKSKAANAPRSPINKGSKRYDTPILTHSIARRPIIIICKENPAVSVPFADDSPWNSIAAESFFDLSPFAPDRKTNRSEADMLRWISFLICMGLAPGIRAQEETWLNAK